MEITSVYNIYYSERPYVDDRGVMQMPWVSCMRVCATKNGMMLHRYGNEWHWHDGKRWRVLTGGWTREQVSRRIAGVVEG